jgi:hypothetical protein
MEETLIKGYMKVGTCNYSERDGNAVVRFSEDESIWLKRIRSFNYVLLIYKCFGCIFEHLI